MPASSRVSRRARLLERLARIEVARRQVPRAEAGLDGATQQQDRRLVRPASSRSSRTAAAGIGLACQRQPHRSQTSGCSDGVGAVGAGGYRAAHAGAAVSAGCGVRPAAARAREVVATCGEDEDVDPVAEVVAGLRGTRPGASSSSPSTADGSSMLQCACCATPGMVGHASFASSHTVISQLNAWPRNGSSVLLDVAADVDADLVHDRDRLGADARSPRSRR